MIRLRSRPDAFCLRKSADVKKEVAPPVVRAARCCAGRVPYNNDGYPWWKGICNWPGSTWCALCGLEIWDGCAVPWGRARGACANGCNWLPCTVARDGGAS